VKTVIVGCGRVGSVLADVLDRAGHQVIVLDTKTSAFDRLPGSFGGAAVRGDGTDEDTLRRAGAAEADVFMALTEGDNRNVMSAQLATEALGAKTVIAKINDPLRAQAYADLGIATLCRTNLMTSAVSDFIGLGMSFGPGLSPATGQHPGGGHHEPGRGLAEDPGAEVTPSITPGATPPSAAGTPSGLGTGFAAPGPGPQLAPSTVVSMPVSAPATSREG
jgi:trk system potassium uptake protein